MGRLIVIEGTDGSGKQTQATKLYEHLTNKGFNVKKFSFPNYDSPSSAPVKMYLSGQIVKKANELDAYQSSALFAVDRLCTMKSFEEFLNNEGILILDRYVQSNMIHQAGKLTNLKERDKFLNWLDELEFCTFKLPRPDLILFLNIPVDISEKLAHTRKELKTGEAKDIHEEDHNHLKSAYDAGIYVANKYNWAKIPCTTKDRQLKTIDEIHNLIIEEVNKKLGI